MRRPFLFRKTLGTCLAVCVMLGGFSELAVQAQEPESLSMTEESGEYAEEPGEYAEESGEYAEESGEYAEESGVSAAELGDIPEEADGAAEDSYSFTQEDLEWLAEAEAALQDILRERTVMALVYLADNYVVRQTPSDAGAAVVTVPSGQTVEIRDAIITEAYEAWVYADFSYCGSSYSGYIRRENLACSDELFLDWEMNYGMNPAAYSVMTLAADDGRATVSYPDIEQFPESYQAALRALKEAHPNWTFVKMNTGLDWNTVVENELADGRSLIPSSFPDCQQEGLYSKSWAYASPETLKYYLDPRNGLTEQGIFQFEQLTYNASYHTEAAVQGFLDNTFMSGIIPDTVLTYAKTFWAVGKELNISPFHLACRVYQEQGSGTSPMISGTYPGYEGYYNYFNIGATGQTTEEILRTGLERAKKENWYNGYYSIYGGAKIIAANYIAKGQDTLYLQKFDVDNSDNSLYWHQYMQNICAPGSEGQNIRKLYEQAGSLDNTFVFKIPVFNNMPASACALPTSSKSVYVSIPEGYSEAAVYLDGVPYTAVKRNGQYIVTAPDAAAKTAVMYRYDGAGVPVGMTVWELSYSGTAYKATELTGLQDLLTYHGFSIRISGNTGIRFKTGISPDVRSALTGSGINGYTLKEYGTLAMSGANLDTYPMVLGGTKVASGMAYGYNSDGQLQDRIFEAVDGRYRYTSVLVDLPVSQYKTEFAFRGYIILQHNGQDVVLYGPIRKNSIYNLAKTLVNSGAYAQGSDADNYLRQLISDADNAENN